MKKLLSLLLALSLLLSLSVCVLGEGVSLTDQTGRQLTLAETPGRIVSGYYISSSALIALGLEDKLVGIEAKAGTRPIYARSAPALMELPSVGTAKEFDLEGCVALKPELVILPAKLKSAAETLEGLGIPVLLVNPESQQQMEQMVFLLGQATGTQDRAEALLSFIAGQRENLETLLADEEKPRVYLAGNSSLLSTAGAGMYQSDMMLLAGGENVAAGIADTYWADISYEQLLAWDPDYIVLASDASYTVEEVLADPNLADCAAVKNGNVLRLPGDAEAWDSPVPGGILGSVWLASALHPHRMSPEDRDAIINQFYETFYGFRYCED